MQGVRLSLVFFYVKRHLKKTKPKPKIFSCFFFQAVLAGDFILSAASVALARIGNITIISVLSQVIEDLVRGKVFSICIFILLCLNNKPKK